MEVSDVILVSDCYFLILLYVLYSFHYKTISSLVVIPIGLFDMRVVEHVCERNKSVHLTLTIEFHLISSCLNKVHGLLKIAKFIFLLEIRDSLADFVVYFLHIIFILVNLIFNITTNKVFSVVICEGYWLFIIIIWE
jgi:hypothetical protein